MMVMFIGDDIGKFMLNDIGNTVLQYCIGNTSTDNPDDDGDFNVIVPMMIVIPIPMMMILGVITRT